MPNMVGSCEDVWSEPAASTECDLDALVPDGELSGDITADRTLSSGKSYTLTGITRVLSGATLTIQPCVKILGTDENALLAILPGAKIEAEGEPDAPIIFTSDRPVGQRAPGDWAGLLILGRAFVNSASEIVRPRAEGLVEAAEYGWHTREFDDESSGTLAYVRVEYVSKELGSDLETNGISFNAVGSGTIVHHVMVSNSDDDCFEWFGGAFSAHHLIAFNCADDMFDTDNGYSGSVQFAFGRQFPTTEERDSSGFEMTTKGSTGATTAQWSNVTLCGTNLGNELSRIGMLLEQQVAGSIQNAVINGFSTGLSRRGSLPVTLTHTLLFNYVDVGDSLNQPPDWFLTQEGNSIEAPDPPFCDCWANPPNPFPPQRISGASTESFQDPDASYIGAFERPDAASNWMTGKWVDWSEQ